MVKRTIVSAIVMLLMMAGVHAQSSYYGMGAPNNWGQPSAPAAPGSYFGMGAPNNWGQAPPPGFSPDVRRMQEQERRRECNNDTFNRRVIGDCTLLYDAADRPYWSCPNGFRPYAFSCD